MFILGSVENVGVDRIKFRVQLDDEKNGRQLKRLISLKPDDGMSIMDDFNDEVSENYVPISLDAAGINSENATSSNALCVTGIDDDLSRLGTTPYKKMA